jgi:hypothetical protein
MSPPNRNPVLVRQRLTPRCRTPHTSMPLRWGSLTTPTIWEPRSTGRSSAGRRVATAGRATGVADAKGNLSAEGLERILGSVLGGAFLSQLHGAKAPGEAKAEAKTTPVEPGEKAPQEETFQDIIGAPPGQSSESGIPSRRANLGETGAAPINSSAEAPPFDPAFAGLPGLDSPGAVGSSTTRATPPSMFEGPAITERFSDFRLGAMDADKGSGTSCRVANRR